MRESDYDLVAWFGSQGDHKTVARWGDRYEIPSVDPDFDGLIEGTPLELSIAARHGCIGGWAPHDWYIPRWLKRREQSRRPWHPDHEYEHVKAGRHYRPLKWPGVFDDGRKTYSELATEALAAKVLEAKAFYEAKAVHDAQIAEAKRQHYAAMMAASMPAPAPVRRTVEVTKPASPRSKWHQPSLVEISGLKPIRLKYWASLIGDKPVETLADVDLPHPWTLIAERVIYR